MDFVAAFNLAEAGWWLAMAAVCGWKGRGPWKAVGRTAAMFFVLFAVSDVIELQTGAWWRPWPLAALKAVCVIGLIGCGIRAWRLRLNPQAHSFERLDG